MKPEFGNDPDDDDRHQIKSDRLLPHKFESHTKGDGRREQQAEQRGGAVRHLHQPENRRQKHAAENQLVAPRPAFFRPPDVQNMPDEKVTQKHAVKTQNVLVERDAAVHHPARPCVKATAPVGKIFYEQNGDGHDDIGASLEHPRHRLARIRLGQHHEHHHRLAHQLGPPLERHKCKIRPETRQQAKNNVECNPVILPDKFPHRHPPPDEHLRAEQRHASKKQGVHRAALLVSGPANVDAKGAEPLRNKPRAVDEQPDGRQPQRRRDVGLLPHVPPEQIRNQQQIG